MLKKHGELFKSLYFILDLVLISTAWVLAYWIRFKSNLIPVNNATPPFEIYLYQLPVIILIWAVIFNAFNLYRPRRISTRLSEVWDVVKACTLAALVLVGVNFLLKQNEEYSRLVFLLFWGLSIVLITGNRWATRAVLRYFRSRGYNQRYALIIGAGSLGKDLAAKLRRHPELGIQVIGYLTRKPGKVGHELHGVRVLGTYDHLPEVLATRTVDQVFITLPHDAFASREKILLFLQDQTVDVRIVPDLLQFISVRGQAEMFDGLPIVTLQATPLSGWNQIMKRSMDLFLSLAILSVSWPLMLLVATLIKVSSPGPVLYRQKRMGYDGRIFEMLKFRSMQVDAEEKTGVVWTGKDDPRRTRMGVFLRSTSLDELPQFWNVLMGQMSIVGPRPERPEFVQKFRTVIPKYMLRHKIKAGITGWAQVNGSRGNGSMEERIKFDLEYIDNWSVWVDLKIMWLTVWKGFIHRNAY